MVAVPGLIRAIEIVAPAISTDQARQTLNGIYLDAPNGAVVSTDGHRMFKVDIGAWDGKAIIIPRTTVDVLIAAKALATDTIQATGEASIGFPLKNGFIQSRLVDGEFPNYKSMFPKKKTSGTKLVVATTVLRDAVKAASAVAESRKVMVGLMFDQPTLAVLAHSDDMGEARIEVAGAQWTGQRCVLGMNGRYLLESLATCGEVVEMRISADLAADGQVVGPVTITSPGSSSVTLTMPMKGSWSLPNSVDTINPEDAIEEPASDRQEEGVYI
jgi:DNA polymerase-3 subunit beta